MYNITNSSTYSIIVLIQVLIYYIALYTERVFLELAWISEGFPSCSRLHCAPTFLQFHPETEGDYNRETKRINGLSVFVKDIEQGIQYKEIPQKIDKARPRLIKINKKESPRTASLAHERQASSESVETVAKKTRRVPKRITATHNFIYEFNPFGNPTTTPGNATKTREIQNLPNVGLEEPFYKSTNSKQNSSNTRPHVASVLPKLNPHSDSSIRNSERHENVSNPKTNASLATIKKQETGVEQRLIKPRAEKQKLISEIDREVERIKSDWRTLRSSTGWTQGKSFANARTRKLYDSLEKMTQDIDKMQKSYMDPKSNRYLHRGAMKALDPADRLSFEEKASKVKSMLFPKDNNKIVDETLNELSNVLKTNLSDVTPSEHIPNKKIERKSLLPNKQSQNGKNNSPSNVHKRNTSANSQKNLKKINSDIERYLHNYINEAEKNFVNKEESKIKELGIHSEDVSDMLKKLNLNSFDIYDIVHDFEENPLSQNVGRTKSSVQIIIEPRITEDVAKISSRMQSSVQTSMDSKVENVEIKDEIAKIVSSKEDDHSTKYNMLNYDTSIQTNTKNIPQTNAFIEMGFHALSNNYSQNALMRVLQSEYLKKDTTLKPI
ncbi:LOW QUALITY PROTEIN: hypothetical protein E2986_13671 [Frieseomelitta varia]|uniref:Uncharacterized protein n=1 Tax=Frieseomelitta varia TaxID=561572 RepID=A0A833VVF3_9HYME|nr:LOW QUALITY PROTEIN: hypothetical protein E2986_13671 [Frieseomelitta varia]